MAGHFTRSKTYWPDALGLRAQVLSAERTSNTIECAGFDQLKLDVNLSSWADASTVSVAIDVSEDGSTWYPIQSESTAAGVATLSDLIWRKSVSAADTWTIFSPICSQKLRVRITSASGGSSDIASVTLRLANMGN